MQNKLSTILLVEDEPAVRIELKKFLQRYSKEVVTATNGAEGLALFKTSKPNIVVSDIKMPKMNGIDMAKKMKEDRPEQTIIFTTAHSDSNFFLDAIEMQVDGYILKPIDLGLLRKKILEITKSFILEKEKRLYANILDDIAQMQDTMIAVYDSHQIPVFFNKKLLSFLGDDTLQTFLVNNTSLGVKFEKHEECYSQEKNKKIFWIDEIKKVEPDRRIVSMKNRDKKESKFFLISVSEKTESKNIIVSFSEITSIVNEKYQYQNDAYTDELTQINNRTKFNIEFANVLEQSHRDKSNLSIILIDIDNFKRVNDSHGHATGDKVLKKFSEFTLQNIRAEDSFARWGGEEFVLLLKNTSIKEATNIAENLRQRIEKYNFEIDQQLTCSLGVSTISSDDTTESLFSKVDKALYKAKNSGRNRVEIN